MGTQKQTTMELSENVGHEGIEAGSTYFFLIINTSRIFLCNQQEIGTRISPT